MLTHVNTYSTVLHISLFTLVLRQTHSPPSIPFIPWHLFAFHHMTWSSTVLLTPLMPWALPLTLPFGAPPPFLLAPPPPPPPSPPPPPPSAPSSSDTTCAAATSSSARPLSRPAGLAAGGTICCSDSTGAAFPFACATPSPHPSPSPAPSPSIKLPSFRNLAYLCRIEGKKGRMKKGEGRRGKERRRGKEGIERDGA